MDCPIRDGLRRWDAQPDVRRDCIPPARRHRRDSGSPDVLGVTGRRRRRHDGDRDRAVFLGRTVGRRRVGRVSRGGQHPSGVLRVAAAGRKIRQSRRAPRLSASQPVRKVEGTGTLPARTRYAWAPTRWWCPVGDAFRNALPHGASSSARGVGGHTVPRPTRCCGSGNCSGAVE